MIHRIVLDMDGVLSNFAVPAILAHFPNADLNNTFKNYPPGQYDLASVLAMTPEKFWAPLDTVAFWESVELYSTASMFVNEACKLACRYGIKVVVATQLTNNPLTAGPKTQLCAQLGLPVYTIHGGDKYVFDDGKTLLVDDCDANHAQWTGPSIVVPQVWNCRNAIVDRSALGNPNYELVLREIREELRRHHGSGIMCSRG